MKLPEINLAEQIFIQFCHAYKNRDITRLLSLFTQDARLWGTAKDEYRHGHLQIAEQLKRDFSQCDKNVIEIISFIPTNRNTTWTAVICDVKVTINHKDYLFEDLRITATLEKENTIFKIAHLHASFPDYRNLSDHSFPLT